MMKLDEIIDIVMETLEPFLTSAITGGHRKSFTTNQETKSHEEQVKDLAQQLSSSDIIKPITINEMVGFSAITSTEEGSTYNVLLQGSDVMLLIQFPNKDSQDSLNAGQLILLNSIQEL